MCFQTCSHDCKIGFAHAARLCIKVCSVGPSYIALMSAATTLCWMQKSSPICWLCAGMYVAVSFYSQLLCQGLPHKET